MSCKSKTTKIFLNSWSSLIMTTSNSQLLYIRNHFSLRIILPSNTYCSINSSMKCRPSSNLRSCTHTQHLVPGEGGREEPRVTYFKSTKTSNEIPDRFFLKLSLATQPQGISHWWVHSPYSSSLMLSGYPLLFSHAGRLATSFVP